MLNYEDVAQDYCFIFHSVEDVNRFYCEDQGVLLQ